MTSPGDPLIVLLDFTQPDHEPAMDDSSSSSSLCRHASANQFQGVHCWLTLGKVLGESNQPRAPNFWHFYLHVLRTHIHLFVFFCLIYESGMEGSRCKHISSAPRLGNYYQKCKSSTVAGIVNWFLCSCFCWSLRSAQKIIFYRDLRFKLVTRLNFRTIILLVLPSV